MSRHGMAPGDALMTAMLASSLDCIVAMDHEGRVLEFNPRIAAPMPPGALAEYL